MFANKRTWIIAGSVIIAIIAITLTVVFSVPRAKTISFMVDDEVYATLKTNGNEELEIPEAPKKEGYTFEGWFKEKDTHLTEFTKDSLVDTKLSEDLTVYAYFLEKNGIEGTDINITSFNTKEIEGLGSALYLGVPNKDDKLDLTNLVKVSPNASWRLYKDSKCEEALENNLSLKQGRNTIYLKVTDRHGDIKVYTLVIDREEIYTITFDSDGGSEVKAINAKPNDKITLTTPAKKGHTFDGWYNNETKVEDGFTFNMHSNLTLKAKWTAVEYTITYNLDGGENNINNPAKYKVTDTDITLANPTKTGYEFLGFRLHGTEDAPKLNYVIDTDGCTNIELDAVYKPLEINVNLHFNDTVETVKVKYDTANLKLKIMDNNGLIFGGYFTDSSLKEEFRFTDSWGKTPKDYVFKYAEDLDLYAKFTRSVSFETNGGEAVSPIKLNIVDKLPENTVTTKPGRTFGGWSTTPALDHILKAGEEFSETKLYAKWNEEIMPTMLSYNTHGLSIEITGSTYTGSDFIVPDYIGGKKVEQIAEGAFSNNTTMVNVYLPNLKFVPRAIFKGCTNIASLDFSGLGIYGENYIDANMESLGYLFGEATEGVSQNGTIYGIPSTLKKVNIRNNPGLSRGMFENCSSLVEVNVPLNEDSNLFDNAFLNCTSLEKFNANESYDVVLAGRSSIGRALFKNCTSIRSIGFTKDTSKITSIRQEAFANLTSLTRFNSLNEGELVLFNADVDTDVFANMDKITSAIISDDFTYSTEDVFTKVNNLVSLTVPYFGNEGSSLGTLGVVFGGPRDGSGYMTHSGHGTRQDMMTYNIPMTLRRVRVTKMTEVTNAAFQNCDLLQEIKYDLDITMIGEDAFQFNRELIRFNSDVDFTVNFPATLSHVGNSAFYCDDKILHINYLGSLPEEAFIDFSEALTYNGNESICVLIRYKNTRKLDMGDHIDRYYTVVLPNDFRLYTTKEIQDYKKALEKEMDAATTKEEADAVYTKLEVFCRAKLTNYCNEMLKIINNAIQDAIRTQQHTTNDERKLNYMYENLKNTLADNPYENSFRQAKRELERFKEDVANGIKNLTITFEIIEIDFENPGTLVEA